MEALATYKEIRGAINAQQKGRQYYRNPGGFGRGAPDKGAGKGKGKSRIQGAAKQKGLNPGGSFDIKNGFDLRSEQDRRRMWRALPYASSSR